MPDAPPARPAICLNMIVRNEAHVVARALDLVAPFISSWVIVDTGSDDGTQDVIRDHMARLGIPGQLYERPWRDFGHNRSEALALAQGRADYIWVLDADDAVVGTPDLTGLDAAVYDVRRRFGSTVYWLPQLFRDGLAVRYIGVTHEYTEWDGDQAAVHLEGAYHVEDLHVSARNMSGEKAARDRDLLLAEVQRHPDDARSVFYLAQSYFDLADYANALRWYARRVELGGWEQEVYFALFRTALSLKASGAPWPQVQDAYLRAWEFRPGRAEPLFNIAVAYRLDQRYQLGYLFARRAAETRYPEADNLFVSSDVYAWRAADERAICASQIGRHAEAFGLCRSLLARADIPDEDRQRIAVNRDFSVPAMVAAAASYPDAVVRSLVAGPRHGAVTVSVIAGPDRAVVEATLNSFLHCCADVSLVGRFLVVDAGLSAADRVVLGERYGFVEFAECGRTGGDTQLAAIRAEVDGRCWLHLGRGWRFFAPEDLIGRLTAVLDAEPRVCAVGVNFGDAAGLTGVCAAEETVRRAPGAGRYLLTGTVPTGPAMFDTGRLDAAGAVPHTATLDEVLCI